MIDAEVADVVDVDAGRTELGVQRIAVSFLEMVNDEIRVGNSLLAVNDIRQLALWRGGTA